MIIYLEVSQDVSVGNQSSLFSNPTVSNTKVGLSSREIREDREIFIDVGKVIIISISYTSNYICYDYVKVMYGVSLFRLHYDHLY